MKFFKLNERSVFAVLLRSPWWVSVLVALVFALAARAVLPPRFVPAAVLGTAPFWVIAVLAARRQWRAPSASRVSAALEAAAAMSWRDFAAQIEQVLQAQGYRVSRLPGDAADFLLERQGQTTLLSCRRWKAAHHGVEALRQLQAAREAHGAGQAIYASLAPVSEAAGHFAKETGIRLVHGQELGAWLAH